jgi:hypothetical protein
MVFRHDKPSMIGIIACTRAYAYGLTRKLIAAPPAHGDGNSCRATQFGKVSAASDGAIRL